MNLYPGVPQDIVQHVIGLVGMLNYVDKPRVQRDVLTLLKDVRSLTPNVGPLMYSNGQQETLIHLNGTIPIHFKGVQYNIPVCVWLPLQYPNRPPIPYVTPTKDMRIKDKHRHVDAAGIVYLPYLNQWNPIRSQLSELSNIMSTVFSDDPPCYKAPANMLPAPQPIHAQPQPQPQLQPQQPPPWQPQPASNTLAQAGAKIMGSGDNSYPPPAYGGLPQQPPQMSPNSAFSAAGSSSASLQPYGSSQPNNSSPSSSAAASSLAISLPSSSNSSHHLSPSSSSPAVAAIAAAAAAAAVSSSSSASVSVDNRAVVKDELVRKVTQKLRTALIDQQKKAAAEMEVLLDQQNQLQARQTTLDKLKVEMNSECGRVNASIEEMVKKTAAMKEWVDKYENRPIVPVDKGVIPKDTWSKQLLESVVEDVAIDDALFYLQRAFADGRLEAQTYFKLVRALARKQFFARSLAIKVRMKLAEQQKQHSEDKVTPGNDSHSSSSSTSATSSFIPAPASNLGLMPVGNTQHRPSPSGGSAFGVYVPPSAASGVGRPGGSFNPPVYGAQIYNPPSFPLTYK